MKKWNGCIAWMLMMLPFNSRAIVTIPDIFGDHMVLQQQAEVPIWGWAKPGEPVVLTAEWAPGQQWQVDVSTDGRWEVKIQTPAAGGPFRMQIQGYNRIELEDILIGEVWLGSGQSNMEWSASLGIDNAQKETKLADYPEIRFFQLSTATAAYPQQLVQGKWVACTPSSMLYFSALMYYFGRELHQTLEVPVGLILSAWGGTPIESWIPSPFIEQDRELHKRSLWLEQEIWGPKDPGVIYNAMIHPLMPVHIKGMLWYQGETNVAYPRVYSRALATLIRAWRSGWGYDFPVYYAQISPYNGYTLKEDNQIPENDRNAAIMRDQQRRVMDMIPGTGMVVTSDISPIDDIHPPNKKDAGIRLANWALKQLYNRYEGEVSGPLYMGWRKENDKAIVSFAHADGLHDKEQAVKGFELAGADRKWYEATAEIQGNEVWVAAAEVPEPVAVRYAFRNAVKATLCNEANLPASCFLDALWQE